VAVCTTSLTGVSFCGASVPVATGAGRGVALFVASPKGKVQVGTGVRAPCVTPTTGGGVAVGEHPVTANTTANTKTITPLRFMFVF
jgi:hypothetical protein